MPTAVTVAAFIELVRSGQYVEAMERFYADDASMQENSAESRRGLATLIAHEQTALTTVQSIVTKHAELVAHDGDAVVIHWVFIITDKHGVARTLDEIAWQHWRGEKILRERFYYDSRWREH